MVGVGTVRLIVVFAAAGVVVGSDAAVVACAVVGPDVAVVACVDDSVTICI